MLLTGAWAWHRPSYKPHYEGDDYVHITAAFDACCLRSTARQGADRGAGEAQAGTLVPVAVLRVFLLAARLVPATNRIANSGYTYDAAGNMTHDADTAYGFDGANRLISANNGVTPATYAYFGALRTKKVVGTTTTVTIYSGTKPIAEYVNGALSKEYIYSGSSLLATVCGGVATYDHPDHLSYRAETNSNGNVIHTYGHFPVRRDLV